MSDPATISTPAGWGANPAPAGAEDHGRGLIERQLGILGRLAEAGLNIALAIERQATRGEATGSEAASPEAAPPQAVPVAKGDLALAYGRAARAVRLTIALQARLLKDLQALDEVAARRLAAEAAKPGRERQAAEAARKARVERIVERLIREEARDEAEGDRLADEAYERLEHDDIYGDLLRKPVSEIIALVCQDLGLAPDWSRLAEEAWAQEELASGAIGSPLARLGGLDPPRAESPPEPAAAPAAVDPRPPDLKAASP